MKVAVFSTKPCDRRFFESANESHGHELTFLETRLSLESVKLAAHDTRLIALRCAGYNNVDLPAVAKHDLTVAREPAYSHHAVAEHTVALLLTLNRKIHRAYNRVREGNFAIEGLIGFDLHGKTVGVVGTGHIGALVCRILHGFGCKLVAYDVWPNSGCEKLGVEYVEREKLFALADIVTLHCPLTPDTHHLIDASVIECMQPGAVIVNTSRGPLVDTDAVIAGLKSGKLSAVDLDVYEEEADLFFEDLSNQVLKDDTLVRLLTLPNVLATSHQAFFTREAMQNIAETTLSNITKFDRGELDPAHVVGDGK